MGAARRSSTSTAPCSRAARARCSPRDVRPRVVTRRLPGERLLYGLFDLVGETLPSIFLARQATLVARGREMASFDAAADAAAAAISEVIHPFALALIEQHKAAGRPVVLATTTPYHLITPLAELLGFDHVIATRYSLTEDGRFDGSLSGRFVWSRGKLAAVTEWAQAEGIDLAESFAYSDSIYDLPPALAVGRPAAVNPDPRSRCTPSRAAGPSSTSTCRRACSRCPVIGVELQRLLFLASPPLLTPYARFDIAGTENIPRTGPAILVGNHRSYFDIPAMIQMMRPTGRTGRTLAEEGAVRRPVVGALATALGGIPVDRGRGGTESFEQAVVSLEGGEMVCLLPQGTIPRGSEVLRPRAQGPHRGGPSRRDHRAPVIPFGVWGSEHVWPRSSPPPIPPCSTSSTRRPCACGSATLRELKCRSAAGTPGGSWRRSSTVWRPEGREPGGGVRD